VENKKPVRKPTSAERAKRREEILRIRTEQSELEAQAQEIEEANAEESKDAAVKQAAHLQPLARPRSGATQPAESPSAESPSADSPSIEELLAEPAVPSEDELPSEGETPSDLTPMPGDETAPAAPEDMPGDMPSDAPSDVPNGIQGTGDDPFMDDQIPNNDAGEAPNRGDFQLEEGNKGATGTEGCEDDKKECRDSYKLIKSTTLDRISLDISIAGVEGQDFPCECEIGGEEFAGRNWSCITYNWTASALCHKPLYFEEPALERYGHSWNPLVQPFISGAHFFATFPVLPYKMGLHHPQECVYTLGYYRPGNCAPYLLPPIPFSLRAAAVQAAAVGGAIAIIP
jgi:hypothetical protein